jgi:Flp pilus assembly protein TadD
MCNKTIAHFVLLGALITPDAIEAAPTCQKPIAKVASAQGKVDVQAYGAPDWQSIHKEDPLCPGDTLRTSRWSRAILTLNSGVVLTLDQSTTMTFSAPASQENVSSWFIHLLEGTIFSRSRQPQRLNINTPFINAVHEGTEFMVTVFGQKTEISVFDGQVSGENSAGKIQVNKGFKGIAEANRPPRVQALKITPEDAVQWMLYYPPIIGDSHSRTSTPDNQLNPALAAYRQGDSHQALAKLEELPVSQQDSRYLTLKAGLLLTVGRVDEAQPLIQQAQRIEPSNSDAFALQAIIAVAKNQQQAALDLANKSVTANPQSSVALIARSYAYQAQFNIDEALKATQEAIRLAPDNALAWARLSELQLSQGDHDAALVSAQKAQALNPKVARTQTILGFADLAQIDIEAAKQAFEQALVIDSSDPLARLGLGLAKIRKGDLEEGKSELETAVNLDPNNAVIRSYLGKAYYELRNKDYAGTEFKIAKEMDSKDPTPWFYDAILKLTTNRPVESLHSMQKAKELNDNRAVYRSSLLLDKDLAARSAAQGRIYNELGFQRLGLVEGWKSVNIDSGNYSAHRLLADNYSNLPRYGIAKASELLQSQLLQPINMTPIQPHLAENNLLLLNGLGPATQSFNEFNPLFERNNFALQTSGIYGSNGTLGDEVVQSGIWDKFSYSLGQFHYESNGFRENNGIETNLYNGFAQLALSADTSLQFEYRDNETKSGDLALNFDPNDFKKNFITKTQTKTARAGLHHKFDIKSDLIMSLIHQSRSINTLEITEDPPIKVEDETRIPTESLHFESQYLRRFQYANLILGFGYLNQDESLVDKFKLTVDGENIPQDPPTPLNRSADYINTYLYSNIDFSKNLTATLGVSFDSLDSKSLGNINKINPKLGLIWKILPSTTFRAAYFETMKRPLISDQSLEPTQVAGFNQFFDDVTAAFTSRYGVAIDHKISENLYGGIEATWRDVGILPDKDLSRKNQSEQQHKAYLYWAPHENFAVNLEYNFESIDRELLDSDVIRTNEIITHRVPIGFSYFHSNGLFSKLTVNYVSQKVQKLTTNIINNNDTFWTMDAELGYRLPKRWGIVKFGVKNVLNEKFNYEQFQFQTGSGLQTPPLFQPGRFIFTQITLSF